MSSTACLVQSYSDKYDEREVLITKLNEFSSLRPGDETYESMREDYAHLPDKKQKKNVERDIEQLVCAAASLSSLGAHRCHLSLPPCARIAEIDCH